jgi:ABC-type transport system involved in cytochrome c biogenesis permease component
MLRLLCVQTMMEVRLLARSPAHFSTLCGAALTMYLLLRFGLPVRDVASAIPTLLLAVFILSILHVTQESFIQDATLDRLSQWYLARLSMEWMVVSRWLAHIVITALPLVICFTGVMWVEMGQGRALYAGVIFMEVAAIAIACGLMTGALVLCFHAASGLAQLLSLPFLFSVVIFAAQTLSGAGNEAAQWVHALTMLLTPLLWWLTAKLL